MMKKFKVDKLTVQVCETREEMGRAAYELYRDRVNGMLAGQPGIRAVFAAAASQMDFLGAMAGDDAIDFTKFTAFHMDEYMGLGADAPQNFGNFLKRAIFSKKPFGAVHYIDSAAPDPDAECERYEKLLKSAPLDIVALGIGENGHLAFNDPHEARFDDPRWVRPTSLDVVSRQQQVNDGEFGSLDEVPEVAVTLTIPALMACRTAICVVPLDRKAHAVREALTGPVSEACPASILRTHDDATLFLDADAASLLPDMG